LARKGVEGGGGRGGGGIVFIRQRKTNIAEERGGKIQNSGRKKKGQRDGGVED